MHRLILSLWSALLLLALTAASALAAPLHQHYVVTPTGAQVPIALGICQNELQQPLDNLHANFHLGAPGSAFATNPVGLTTALPCP